MYREELDKVSEIGKTKVRLLKENPLGYFVSGMVAGMFISFGSFVAMTGGGMATAAGYGIPKLLAAILFASALSLVTMAGCELFTGNHLYLGAALLEKEVTLKDALGLWGFCFLGNLAGSLLLCGLFEVAGCMNQPDVAAYFTATAAAKSALGAGAMFIRGILCNICVCLAVWCSVRMKSESGKLIMVLWCILIFMLCGFEHSVANMSIIGEVLIHGGADGVTLPLYIKNLFFVSLGNVVGGVGFVALPYAVIAHKKGDRTGQK